MRSQSGGWFKLTEHACAAMLAGEAAVAYQARFRADMAFLRWPQEQCLGGFLNTAAGSPMFLHPRGTDGWDLLKFGLGFVPVLGTIASGIDFVNACR